MQPSSPLQREQHDDLDGPAPVVLLQARDLAFLLGNAPDSVQPARFQLDYVQACDMFPQTRFELSLFAGSHYQRHCGVMLSDAVVA